MLAQRVWCATLTAHEFQTFQSTIKSEGNTQNDAGNRTVDDKGPSPSCELDSPVNVDQDLGQ